MKRTFFSSTTRRCGPGRRVTYFDETGAPLVSLWAADGDGVSLHHEATRLLSATPEPIDAILQAIAWNGKAAQV